MVSRGRKLHVPMGLLSLIVTMTLFTPSGAPAAAEPQVITLTQTPCQFVESEGVDRKFKSHSAEDCKSINKKSGKERLAKAKTLELKPGKYIFRVTNKNVHYELGFYLRGAGITGRLTLPKVSGGGLKTGVTKDYEVDLKEGEYYYSCPLNPTPDYKLEVKQ